MSTIAENLDRLVTAKNDITDAIKDKFVKVTDTDGFEEFPDLIRKIGEPIDPSDLTYDQIASIVRSGKAEEWFKIGDQILTTYTATNGTQYEMPFDVVAFRNVELEDGSTVPGMVIQSHYASVENMQFDAPEPLSPDSDVKTKGWNRWLYSGIRQWLNSDKAKGLWWTSAHSYDAAPNNLSTVNGFMKGLPTDFINMLKKTKNETALNYKYPSGNETTYTYDITYDMFFLPSVKEEHFKCSSYPTYWDSSDKEGTDWEYWIQRKGETPIEYGYANTNSIRYSLEDKSRLKYVWLRSAMRYSSNSEFLVAGSYLGERAAAGSSASSQGVAPACVIC